MNTTTEQITGRLATATDYWEEARAGLHPFESLDGMLPASRGLPECPLASELAAGKRGTCPALLEIAAGETTDSRVFRNALLVLMHLDSLFVYRRLRGLCPTAPDTQRRWLDAACRKIILRCVEVSEESQDQLTREIVRNTWRGRLATTAMAADLAADLWRRSRRRIAIRDMAVSDGITTLDLVEAVAAREVPAVTTGTDLRLFLTYAEIGGDRAVALSDGSVLQLEIGGTMYGVRQNAVSAGPAGQRQILTAALTAPDTDTISILAPQVASVAKTRPDELRFCEEDAFDPPADIVEADIIRIANLFVERTDDHRGYYYRGDILAAMAQLGRRAKDGARLLLNNFRKKIEHVGHWRNDASSRQWIRIPVCGPFAPDLDDVESIPWRVGWADCGHPVVVRAQECGQQRRPA